MQTRTTSFSQTTFAPPPLRTTIGGYVDDESFGETFFFVGKIRREIESSLITVA